MADHIWHDHNVAIDTNGVAGATPGNQHPVGPVHPHPSGTFHGTAGQLHKRQASEKAPLPASVLAPTPPSEFTGRSYMEPGSSAFNAMTPPERALPIVNSHRDPIGGNFFQRVQGGGVMQGHSLKELDNASAEMHAQDMASLPPRREYSGKMVPQTASASPIVKVPPNYAHSDPFTNPELYKEVNPYSNKKVPIPGQNMADPDKLSR